MPGRRASRSATPVAPLRSMAARSTMETSATRSASGCVDARGGDHGFAQRGSAGSAWAEREDGQAAASASARGSGGGRGPARAAKETELSWNGKLENQDPSGFPAGVWASRHGRTAARVHLVGRYPGWQRILRRLPRRLFQGAQWLMDASGAGEDAVCLTVAGAAQAGRARGGAAPPASR